MDRENLRFLQVPVEIRDLMKQYLLVIFAGLLFLLYGFFRAIEKPGMSVVLTVISLGLRVILAYALSAIPMWRFYKMSRNCP